jgi:hypothetical protein
MDFGTGALASVVAAIIRGLFSNFLLLLQPFHEPRLTVPPRPFLPSAMRNLRGISSVPGITRSSNIEWMV